MIRAIALLSVAASPVWSQNTDEEQRAVEAYVACVSINGDVAVAAPTFAVYGWTEAEETAEGTLFSKPGFADTTTALFANDGSTCLVASTKVGTKAALAVLTDALRFTAFPDFAVETDDNSCTLVRLDETATATLTDGGEPAACLSDTRSAIRFAVAPQD